MASALGIPLRGRLIQASLQQPAEQLRAYSYTWCAEPAGTEDWTGDPDLPETPAASLAHSWMTMPTSSLARTAQRLFLCLSSTELITAQALLELCDLVAAEDGRGPGLAAGLASIDVVNPVLPEGYEAVAKLNFAIIAAIEADASSHLAL